MPKQLLRSHRKSRKGKWKSQLKWIESVDVVLVEEFKWQKIKQDVWKRRIKEEQVMFWIKSININL